MFSYGNAQAGGYVCTETLADGVGSPEASHFRACCSAPGTLSLAVRHGASVSFSLTQSQ